MLECEKMYVRIEMKFNMTNEDIRDRHQKFLAGQKSGEMNLQNFIEYAKKEKNMTAYLAESLFRQIFQVEKQLYKQFPKYMLCCTLYMIFQGF